MGMRRSFKPTNIVTNGNFSKGITGWILNMGTSNIVTGGYQDTTALECSGNAVNYPGRYTAVSVEENHKYYGFGYFKRTSGDNTGYFGFIGANYPNGNATFTESNYTRKSFLTTAGVSSSAVNLFILVANTTAVTGSIVADKIGLIDLTALFGAGNEPTLVWCDANFPAWFDGTLSSGKMGGTGGLK